MPGLLNDIQCPIRAYICKSCKSVSTGASLCRSLLIVTHGLFILSSAELRMLCLSYLYSLEDAVLWGAASRNCSTPYVSFLCSSYLPFSKCASLAILTRPLLGIILISYFYMMNILTIVIHAFSLPMLAPLSVHEILLARYINLSLNFKGLAFIVERDWSGLKHTIYVIIRLF